MSSLKKVQPYNSLSDIERLRSNWKKALKLYRQKDWSASMVCLATAMEISANIYIRECLINKFKLPSTFVDSLLKSANGINRKFQNLITPAARVKKEWPNIKKIKKKIDSVNTLRNKIVHRGRFMNKDIASQVFKSALEVVEVLSPLAAKSLDVPENS